MNAENQEPLPSPFADELETETEEEVIDQIEEEEVEEEEVEDGSDEDEESLEEEEDEEGEPEDADDDDEALQELIDEVLGEDDDDDSQQDVVPHAALHQERERRKTTQKDLQQQVAFNQQQTQEIDRLQQTLEGLRVQVKELGIDDVITIDEAKSSLPPELEELMQQKQQQAQQDQLRQTAMDIKEEMSYRVLEYPVLQSGNEEQEQAIMGLTLANMQLGQDIEAATESAMKLMNMAVANAKKEAMRVRPSVKRGKSSKTKTAARRNKQSAIQRAVKKGQYDRSVFDDIAGNILNK